MMQKICGNCNKYCSLKSDDGRYYYCKEEKIYNLFHSDIVDYYFGCIWFEPIVDEYDEIEILKENRKDKLINIKYNNE